MKNIILVLLFAFVFGLNAQEIASNFENVVFDVSKKTKLKLVQNNDSIFSIVLFNKKDILSVKKQKGTPFRFFFEDINGDSVKDIIVGLNNPNYKKIQKRLVCYKIVQNTIKKMWVGTYLGLNMQDFRIIDYNNWKAIKTLEKFNQNSYIVAIYVWNGFGFRLIKRLEDKVPYKKAFETYMN